MARIPKSDFLRAVVAFNPSVFGKPGTIVEFDRLTRMIQDYDAKDGGKWNYINLYSTITAVLKGMPLEQALSFLSSLDGNGEAKAKLGLFKRLAKHISFDSATNVDVGPTVVEFDETDGVRIKPDFCYKKGETVVWVFVYPNKKPALKKFQREAIVNVLARPIPLAQERHVLLIAEYPEISGKRTFRAEEFEFDYREESIEFKVHLATFFRALVTKNASGDLFD